MNAGTSLGTIKDGAKRNPVDEQTSDYKSAACLGEMIFSKKIVTIINLSKFPQKKNIYVKKNDEVTTLQLLNGKKTELFCRELPLE